MAKRRTTKSAPESSTSTSIGEMSVAQLRDALAQHERMGRSLQTRRATLVEKLKAVDAQIAAMGGMVASGKRPRNDATLVEALTTLLTGKEMTVNVASEEVQKVGYMTTSPAFRTIVNQTLINHPKRFKRVSRGVYTAKG